MRLIVSGPVTKRCPYKDEVDHGTATITFDVANGDGPEIHSVAKQLSVYAELLSPMSHEQFTRELLTQLGASRVVTTWTTAGLDVVCEADE